MKFVFFDIECANSYGNIGKMCSFGYVVTDENFNVLTEPTDLLIDPAARFHWYVRDKILAYPVEDFLSQEKFPERYENIKNLLAGDVLAIGFDVKTDVLYLLDECFRNKLLPFSFKYFDVLKLSENYSPKCGGLKKAFLKWCDGVAEEKHKSSLDAYYTMRVFKSICEQTGFSAIELIQKHNDFCGETHDFKYGFYPNPLNEYKDKFKKKKKRKKVEAISPSDTVNTKSDT